MKNLVLFLLLSLFSFQHIQAQAGPPEFSLEADELEAHLRFIASDELQGRRTGETGNNIAARYLAEQLRSYGVKQVAGHNSYFQSIPFIQKKPAKSGHIRWGEHDFTHGDEMLVLAGNPVDFASEAVFAGHGWIDQEEGVDHYKDLDVKGKIVFVLSGRPGVSDPMETFRAMKSKQKWAAEKGAVALVEIYKLSFPWQFFKGNFNRTQLGLAPNPENPLEGQSSLPYCWLDEGKTGLLKALKGNTKEKFELSSSGNKSTVVYSQNVIGIIEGSDPNLQEEYVILSAHYDHVGVGAQGGGAYTEEDSIFNGARDNGMGTVALLAAAKSLAITPPKRSVIILAVTGEEMGLLGSSFYVEHPLIPLEKTVFNLNTDGAGYNDKSKISIIGFHRVGAAKEMGAATKAFGLEVFPDPAPEQNLFDRSDNVNFARKGIPAPNLSPGTTGFDATIRKYYHQVTDNPDTIDYAYLLKYCQVYAHTARLVADKSERPKWKAGDKYEAAGKALYGN